MEKQRIKTIDDRFPNFYAGDYEALLSTIPRAISSINDTASTIAIKVIDYEEQKSIRCVCSTGAFRFTMGITNIEKSCECIADVLILSRHRKGYVFPTTYCTHCLVNDINRYWKKMFTRFTYNHDCKAEKERVVKEHGKLWIDESWWDSFVPECGNPEMEQDGCRSGIGTMPICNPINCNHDVHYCRYCVKVHFEKMGFDEKDIEWLVNTKKYNDITKWIPLRNAMGDIDLIQAVERFESLDITHQHHSEYYHNKAKLHQIQLEKHWTKSKKDEDCPETCEIESCQLQRYNEKRKKERSLTEQIKDSLA